MKKLVVAIAVGMVCLGAMAQGRVTFANNSTRLVYWADSNAAITQADAAANGLIAQLWVGATAQDLVLGLSQASWSVNPGQWTSLTGALPTGFPGGSVDKWWMQVRIVGNGGLSGASEVFQAYASSSPISANNITVAGTPTFSTWANGTQLVTGAAAGALGAIAVTPVPEPTSFALAGLGAAALLIFRRRS